MSHESDDTVEIGDTLHLLLRVVGELKLEVAAVRAVAIAHGVTAAEFKKAETSLRRRLRQRALKPKQT